jgi:rod shape-determining protein MreC
MGTYLNYKSSNKSNYSVKHSFDLIFNKIKTVFFSFLCIVFLVISKVNGELSREISSVFINVSLPVVSFITFPINSVVNLLVDFRELVDAKRKNKILEKEIDELRAFYIKSLNVYQENKELRNSLSFAVTKSNNFKIARIIGRSSQLFGQKLLINAGKKRGLSEGNVVTGDQGMIGRLIEVSDDNSRLMLLTDARSRIPIITSQARTRGILSGNGSDTMEIMYLSKDHEIKVGDQVFTSGDGDYLPIGLLVGIVTKAEPGYAEVKMIEDINNIDIVTIMSY